MTDAKMKVVRHVARDYSVQINGREVIHYGQDGQETSRELAPPEPIDPTTEKVEKLIASGISPRHASIYVLLDFDRTPNAIDRLAKLIDHIAAIANEIINYGGPMLDKLQDMADMAKIAQEMALQVIEEMREVNNV